MKYFAIVLMSLSFSAFSQDSETTIDDSSAVRATIDQLFQGMKNGDSTLVAAVFHPEIQMMSTFTDEEGNPRSHKGSAAEFKNAVGTPHDQVWDERISNVRIQIDGNLAQAWMDYSFYLDDTFSHCGVNAIQLFKTNEGWKMVHLADTRRRSDCN
ncbi:MAG: nuclear transport factor 2 family protein [bacterium]|nr:nuclear transport factor 2 family protein [bacterium]